MDEHYQPRPPGEPASAPGQSPTSRRTGALPVLNGFFKRLRIEEFFSEHVPREDRRSRVPTATAFLLLVRNLLISREPLYGVGEWAAQHDKRWLDLPDEQPPSLKSGRPP